MLGLLGKWLSVETTTTVSLVFCALNCQHVPVDGDGVGTKRKKEGREGVRGTAGKKSKRGRILAINGTVLSEDAKRNTNA